MLAVLDLGQLVGSWRLSSVGVTFDDTQERVEPFGQNPDGFMVLDPGGRIMFLFIKPNRQPPSSDAERAALFEGMVAYTGLARLEGPGRLITTVDLAWRPAWSGRAVAVLPY